MSLLFQKKQLTLSKEKRVRQKESKTKKFVVEESKLMLMSLFWPRN